ncbi:MAG: hypothetical protein AAGF47_05080 [Planctomycetota bacterium]
MSQSPIDDLTALDRRVQAEAVATIAADLPTREARLIELWTATDRYDVRRHIVESVVRSGDPGLKTLNTLTTPMPTGPWSLTQLIAEAYAEFGEAGINALVDRIEAGEPRVGYQLHEVIRAAGIDPATVFSRLIASDSTVVRQAAVGSITVLLPRRLKAKHLIELCADADEQVRMAAAHQIYPHWIGRFAETDPDAFEKYIKGLERLLDSDDQRIVLAAAGVLAEYGSPSLAIQDRFEAIWRSDDTIHGLRTSAMKAYLRTSEDKRGSIKTIIDVLRTRPLKASGALAAVDHDLFDESDIRAIVAALPSAVVPREDYNLAADLIVPVMGGRDGRARLGVRALPALLEALDSDARGLSPAAAAVLRQLGPDAAEAVPQLIRLLERDRAEHHGTVYAIALIAIAPNDPAVIEALTRLIEGVTQRSDDPAFVAHSALKELARKIPEAGWVQALAEPTIRSSEHVLHDAVSGLYPLIAFGDVFERDADRLIAELLDNAALRESAQPTSRPDDRIKRLTRRNEERERRFRAANALRTISDPEKKIVDALLEAMTNRIAFRRNDARDTFSADQEAYVINAVARTIAEIIDRHPHQFEYVVLELTHDRRALSLVLSAAIPGRPHMTNAPEPPADLSDHARQIARRALLDEMRLQSGDSVPIPNPVLCYYGADDAEVRRLTEQAVLFGPGEGGPTSAMRLLGALRPTTPEQVELIREHLSDPRGSMRVAASAAAGRLGPDGAELIDDLIELGRRWMGYSTAYVVRTSLQEIAPDDERVERFKKDHDRAKGAQREALRAAREQLGR